MSGDWELFKLQLAALGGLLFLSLSVTWIILYYVRLLDHPNDRSSHLLATPKCGGVGIVVSFVAGVLISQLWGQEYQAGRMLLVAIIVPVLMVAAISLADDIQELPPLLRLGVQAAAAVLFLCLANISTANMNGGLPYPYLQSVWMGLGVIWLVGMANAFNFMDGIDGLAAGQGLIASFFFGVIQIGSGECLLGFISLVLVVGCLGFLAFNFPPAKVFMGDVGSVSIGFILAALATLALLRNPSLRTGLIMPLLMSNFILDTVTTFTSRLVKRECVFQAHRNHLYQKLARCGFSQRTVAMINYGMAVIQGLVVLLFVGEKTLFAILVCFSMQIIYSSFVKFKFHKRVR